MLAGLLGADNRVPRRDGMLAGMPVLGVVAAPRLATRDAETHVDPLVAGGDALDASSGRHRVERHFPQFAAQTAAASPHCGRVASLSVELGEERAEELLRRGRRMTSDDALRVASDPASRR
jgi:hypothetical protein